MSGKDFKFKLSPGGVNAARLFAAMKAPGAKLKLGFIGPLAEAAKQVSLAPGEEAGPAQTVVEVAAQHEFGLGVPPRPMIRGWVDANSDMILDDLRAAMRTIAQGGLTTESALQVLGVKWVASVQEYIDNSSNFLPLSQATIDKKGSSSPLIDTGQMKSSVTFEILGE